ncbi:hypothetical protein EMCRGX_G034657 [Ephydatia muelleri]
MADYRYPHIVQRPSKPPEEYAKIERSNAIEKWSRMRERTVEHFKFTPKTSFYAIFWAALVPFGLYNLIKWDLRRQDIKKVSQAYTCHSSTYSTLRFLQAYLVRYLEFGRCLATTCNLKQQNDKVFTSNLNLKQPVYYVV